VSKPLLALDITCWCRCHNTGEKSVWY